MGAYISHERIDVHLRIQNNIQPEHFEYSVHLRDVPKQTLIHHLELAADIDPHFNFSSSYHSRSGYFIDAINGLKSKWNPDKTYWEILNSDLKQTEIVSKYIPSNGELVIFNFNKKNKNGDNLCKPVTPKKDIDL